MIAQVLVEGLILGILLMGICMIGIRNGAVGMVHLYHQDVQDRCVELGLTTHEKIRKNSKTFNFPYLYQHLSYEYGSHLFVPMELRSTKFFKGDRGKNKENGRKARMESLVKILEFVSKW